MSRLRHGKHDCSSLAVRLKSQMNDIIDVAYGRDGKTSEAMLRQLKRFNIFCTEQEMSSRWGDCRWNTSDRSSQIRIVNMQSASYKDVLVTTVHEVAHHIDFSFNDHSGHQEPFYNAFSKLLFACFDMGILVIDDVQEHNSRCKQNTLKRLRDYIPNPVDYKKDIVQILVSNCFEVKNDLKARGYRWNPLDASWSKEINKNNTEEEMDYLLSLGLQGDDIKTVEGGAVVVRLKKFVRLYNVPYDDKETVKKYGYRWSGSKEKCWEKTINKSDIPADERAELKKISGIRIMIT